MNVFKVLVFFLQNDATGYGWMLVICLVYDIFFLKFRINSGKNTIFMEEVNYLISSADRNTSFVYFFDIINILNYARTVTEIKRLIYFKILIG